MAYSKVYRITLNLLHHLHDNDSLHPPPTHSTVLRNNFPLKTWLLLILLGPLTLLPTVLILVSRTTSHALMTFNLPTNRYMTGVILTRYSAQYPKPDGSFCASGGQKMID
ncbi:hypothetical protein BDV12DRAFT_180307 [Aspergillus spectabilis]